MKISITPTLSENFNKIKQAWPQPVYLPISKKSNEYRYFKCTAVSISILNVENTVASISILSSIEVFFSIDIDIFSKKHFITYF